MDDCLLGPYETPIVKFWVKTVDENKSFDNFYEIGAW